MVDYKAIQEFLTEKILHFITFYTKVDKPVIAVTRHMPGTNSAEEITVALQEMDYDVISVKRSTPEGVVSHTSFPLFLVTLATNQEAPEMFKLIALCNMLIKVKAYRSQNGLTQCNICHRSGHICVHCWQPPRCLPCGGWTSPL
jgi:hypothetical protein